MRFVMAVAPWAWLISLGIVLPSLVVEWEEDAWQIPPAAALLAALCSTALIAWFWATRRFKRVLVVATLTVVALPYFALWWNSDATRERRALEAVVKWGEGADLPRDTAEATAWHDVVDARTRLARARLDLVQAEHMHSTLSQSPAPWVRVVLLILPGALGLAMLVFTAKMSDRFAKALLTEHEPFEYHDPYDKDP